MTTALDICNDALQEIGVLGVGETASSADAQYALRSLNRLIQAWATESLMVYNIESEIFNYVPNQAVYTIGTGGNFNIERPIVIEAAYNRLIQSDATVDLPIQVTTVYSEYSDITVKSVATPIPVIMYDDGNFPLKNLTFYPVPSSTQYKLVLWFWKTLSDSFSLSSTVSFPPAYERAIIKNLAMELVPAFGRKVSQLLMQQAIDSKAQIKRINVEIPRLKAPGILTGRNNLYSRADFLAGA